MLRGTFEWTVVFAMTAVIAVIGSWYAVLGLGLGHGTRKAAAPPVPTMSVARPVAPKPPNVGSVSRPRHRSTRTWFRFEGARGDSWLQVRAGSPRARVLFDGTLAQGTAVRFRVRSLWVRFGSTNVNLRVAGERVRLPRMGTYDAYVTRAGVRPDPTVHVAPARAP